MAMQYDVKSKHASVSGLMVAGRVRLKGAVMFPFTGATNYATFVDDVSISGIYARATTTATITAANHGLSAGDWVYLDWDLTDNPYQVQTVTNANVFTVTVADSGAESGNVTVWNKVLLQADASTANAYTIVVPGEGILAYNGIRIFLPANFHATVFYG
jgi:hypothetical protein